MKLKVLGSSSHGNCYILENATEALIIEAGIPFKEVTKALDFNLRKVVGCLVTHRHNDHSKYIKSMVDAGFYVLALPDVWTAKGINGSRCISIEENKGYLFGGFRVLPYTAYHDVPCVGYMIEHQECGKIQFLTDSYQCLARFSNLSHMMIESNYSEEALQSAIDEGRTMASQVDRLRQSHMELHDCLSLLASTDLSSVVNVILLHLSDNNSQEEVFIREAAKITGKAVYAAYPGMELDMTKI